MKFHNSIVLVLAQTLFWPSLFSTFNQTSFDKNVALYGNKIANLMELQNVTQELNQKIVRPVIKAPLFAGSADKDAQEALQKQAFIEKRKTQLLIKKAGSSTLQDIAQKIGLATVKLSYAVPAFLGVSDTEVQEYLQQQGVFEEIKALWATFQNNQTLEETTIQPQAASALTSIQDKIRTAFSGENSHLFKNKDFEIFLTQAKNKEQLLMVRSTGKEDSKGNVNAGGNESISAVAPDALAITKAMGEVVASYFSQRSISQRLMAKDPGLLDTQAPFFMPVLLQVMIGEAIGGSTHQNDIPVSGVMFSREAEGRTPGVTHIQATYGHNEGIVNGTVAFDTFYIGSSLIVHPLVQIKRMRLVPVHGSLLEKRDNPAALQRTPCLSFEQLKALKKCADAIEIYYNEPDGVDIEFVVQRGTVFIVQARPVAHKKSEPSYIHKDYLQTSSPANIIPLTVISAGGGQTHIINSDQSILVADTIREAYDTFLYTIKDKAAVKTVLLGHMAPSMSHEVNMLRGAGIQVAYLENLDTVRAWLKEVSNHPLIIDTQRELIVKFIPAEQFHSAENCIQQGWFTHPIAKKVSVFTAFNIDLSAQQLAKLKPEMPLVQADFQTLINQIQEADTQAAQAALKTLLFRVARRIAMEKQPRKTETDPTVQAELSNVFAQLRAAVYEAFTALETWERSGKTPQDKVARLYPVTFIQALIQQLPAKDLFVNDFSFGSLLKTATQEQVLTKELAISGKESARITQYAKASQYALTDEVQKDWQTFLKGLSLVADPVLHNDFATVMYNVASMDILPLWINTSFAQASKTKGLLNKITRLWKTSSPEALEATPQNIATTLIKEFNASKNFIDELQKKKTLLTALSIESWENPLTFNKTWGAFNSEFVTYFASKDFINNYEAAPELGKFAALSLMQLFVSTFDTSIKTLEASKVYEGKDADTKKVENVKIMLYGYFSILEQWLTLLENDTELVKNLLFNKPGSSLKDYLTLITQFLNSTTSSTNQLVASSGFNVAAMSLGSQALWERSMGDSPTLEDIFSLTHQNLLIVLGSLTKKSSAMSMPIPPLVTLLQKAVSKNTMGLLIRNNANLLGINFTADTLTYYYNTPLRNHSNTFQIAYNIKTKETTFSVQFLGQARERWDTIAQAVFLTATIFDLPLEKTPKVDTQRGIVSFDWKIKNTSQANRILELFSIFNKYSSEEAQIGEIADLLENKTIKNSIIKFLQDPAFFLRDRSDMVVEFLVKAKNISNNQLNEVIQAVIEVIKNPSVGTHQRISAAITLLTDQAIKLSDDQRNNLINIAVESIKNPFIGGQFNYYSVQNFLVHPNIKLSDNQRSDFITAVIESARNPSIKSPYKLSAIISFLTATAIKLSDDQRNNLITAAIESAKNPSMNSNDKMSTIINFLTATAINLSNDQKNVLINTFIESAKNPSIKNPYKLSAIIKFLTATSIKLSDDQRNNLINAAIESVKNPSIGDQFDYQAMQKFLTDPAIKLSDEQRSNLINAIIESVKNPSIGDQFDYQTVQKFLTDPAIKFSDEQRSNLINAIIESIKDKDPSIKDQDPSINSLNRMFTIINFLTDSALNLSTNQKNDLINTFIKLIKNSPINSPTKISTTISFLIDIDLAINLSTDQKNVLINTFIELIKNSSTGDYRKGSFVGRSDRMLYVKMLLTNPAIKLSDEQKAALQRIVDSE